MAAKKRTGAGFNLFLTVVIIALFGVGIYFLTRAQEGPTSIIPAKLTIKNPEADRQEYLSGIKAKYDAQTLEYVDETYGYKLRFPVTYQSVMQPFPGIHQRILALAPPFNMELMDVRILSPVELNEAAINEGAEEFKVPVKRETINGKPAYLISVEDVSPLEETEKMYFRQAFIDCKNATGFKYWFSFTVGISQALAADLELTDYMIHSVEC